MYQFIEKVVEQCGIPLCTILKHLGNAFSTLFGKLKKLFPPPSEASGHEKRMDKMNTTLDRVEECFFAGLQQAWSEQGIPSKSDKSSQNGCQICCCDHWRYYRAASIPRGHPFVHCDWHAIIPMSSCDSRVWALGTSEGWNCCVVARVGIWRGCPSR